MSTVLRPDCRRPYQVRSIELQFPSREGVVVAAQGKTVVQAAVFAQTTAAPTQVNKLLEIQSDIENVFCLDRVIRQVFNPNLLLLQNGRATKLLLRLTTLERDSDSQSLQITAAAAALLHCGYQPAFVPVCCFESKGTCDPLSSEGEIDLKQVYDKGGNLFLVIGRTEFLEPANEQCKEISNACENAVLDDLDRRRERAHQALKDKVNK